MELSSLFLAGKGSALTSFFSTAFLVVFLPFCLVVYSLMPRRGKKYFLLAADCAFFWLISGKLLVYLLLTALSMHYFGLWLDKIQSETKLLLAQTEKAERKTVRKRQQAVQHRILLLAVILHIGVLFALKYSGFAATNVNTLLAHLHIPVQLAIPKYVMPIGISFFTLQALSYIVDVQRGVTKADTNLLRLTLFISFFPQIVEGPICRYDQTAQQLWDAKPITYENLTLGLQRIAYGMMKKIIIADRLNPLVRNVFNSWCGQKTTPAATASMTPRPTASSANRTTRSTCSSLVTARAIPPSSRCSCGSNTVTRPIAAAHPDRLCTIRKRSCTKPSRSSRPSL